MILLGIRVTVQKVMAAGDAQVIPGGWDTFVRLVLLTGDLVLLSPESNQRRLATRPFDGMTMESHEGEEQINREVEEVIEQEEVDQYEDDDIIRGSDPGKEIDSGEEEKEDGDGRDGHEEGENDHKEKGGEWQHTVPDHENE